MFMFIHTKNIHTHTHIRCVICVSKLVFFSRDYYYYCYCTAAIYNQKNGKKMNIKDEKKNSTILSRRRQANAKHKQILRRSRRRCRRQTFPNQPYHISSPRSLSHTLS